MNNNHDFFSKLTIESKITEHIKSKIHSANESDWVDHLEQSILPLKLEDLEGDLKIAQLVKDIGDQKRLGVYRLPPNICYGWHIDSKRCASINMLIDGYDSMCVFGTQQPFKKFTDLTVIHHDQNSYYLMNVKKFHTVYNFNNQRYVLSLGIAEKTFSEVQEYLRENGLL